MKKAVILCAGRGSRLYPLTNFMPKSLVKVNGLSFLDNAVQNLIKTGYKELVIVIGYQGQIIRQEVEKYETDIKITIVENPEWESTNNIYSLWMAKEELFGDVTLIEGDIFFNEEVLNELNNQTLGGNYIVVSKLTEFMEGTFVEAVNGLVQGFHSTKLGQHRKSKQPLKTANIYRFSNELCKFVVSELDKEIATGNVGIYYEEVLNKALCENFELRSVEVQAKDWFEVDNVYDKEICEMQFSDNKLDKIQSLHGGYWRYPISDFALIYNFHFPPKSLKTKMSDHFNDILLNYPSCSDHIKNYFELFFELKKDHIVIANGASELIKVLPRIINGKFILIEPSFNEYFNSIDEEKVIKLFLNESNNFDLNIEELIELAQLELPESIVLNTPNNPTGRLISKEDIIKLYHETEDIQTTIILDESFLDFSDNRITDSFLHDLEIYPRIIILRSMSKTFGIGGLRLGYAATSDLQIIQKLSKEIPIWNINGFAEEFILNLPQYKTEYIESCKKVRLETNEFYQMLCEIKELKVLESDSNFMLCKIKDKEFTASFLASELLNNHGIYIKECSGKSMEDAEYYFRVSSRTKKENLQFILSLKEVLVNKKIALIV